MKLPFYLGLSCIFALGSFLLPGQEAEVLAPAEASLPPVTEEQKQEIVEGLQDGLANLWRRVEKTVEAGGGLEEFLDPAMDTNAPSWLGVQLDGPEPGAAVEEEPADGKEKGENAPKGVGIVRIIPDSPAANSGIKEGDRVLAFRGKVVNDADELRGMIRETRPGRTVKFTIRREGKDQDLRVKLGEMPQDMQAGLGFNFNNGPAAVPGMVVFNQSGAARLTPDDDPETSVLAPTGQDAVILRDENILFGKLQSLDLHQGLTLSREGAPPLVLEASGITSLALLPRTNGDKPRPASAVLQLRDGTWLSGEKFALESGKISLTLPNGGPVVEIPREKAAWASLAKGTAPQAYEGPYSLNGWQGGRYNQGRWEYRDRGLECVMQGSIGRRFELLPAALDVSFDVTYPGSRDQFTVWLFSGDVSSGNMVPGVVWMNFSPMYISANQYDGQRMNNYGFALKGRKDADPERLVTTRYRILADRVAGKIVVYINGARQVEWKISRIKPEDLGKTGSCFSVSSDIFVPKSTFRLSNIRLFPWSGQEPGKDEKALPAAAAGDRILLGSTAAAPVEGQVERVTENEIQMAAGLPALSREKTAFIQFGPRSPAGEAAEPPPAAGGALPTATLQLSHQGEFPVVEVQANDQQMSVKTLFSNDFILPLTAVRSLRFGTVPGNKAAAEPAAAVDVLTLLNGSRLNGTFVPGLGGCPLQWRIAAVKEPLDFPVKDVAGILLAPTFKNKEGEPPLPPPGLTGSATVRFSNGDWLPGEVTKLDAGKLVLKNELKDSFTFTREALASIYLNPASAATVVDGASGRERWPGFLNNQYAYDAEQQAAMMKRNKSRWNFFDGGYGIRTGNNYMNEGIGREVPAFPGAYAIHFSMVNQGNMPWFILQLYGKDKQPLYNLYYSGSEINVTRLGVQNAPGNGVRIRGGAGRFVQQNRMERFPMENQRTPGKAIRFTLVSDRAGKAFHLIADGKNIGKYQMKDSEAEQGGLDIQHLSIMPLGGMGTSRVYDIWMAPWGGDLPSKSAGTLPIPLAEGQQKIHLANGDEVIGKIEAFHPGHLALSTEIGALDLPLSRIALLQYEGQKTEAAPAYPRLRFYTRGLLTVKELRIEGETVQCQSLQNEALSFPLHLVKEIVLQAPPAPPAGRETGGAKRGQVIHF